MPGLEMQSALVGRETELRELEANLEDAEAGNGKAIIVSGEAGVGKTRLLEELRSVAEAKGFLFLTGYSLHESLTPYVPFVEALKSGGLEYLFAEEAPRVEAAYLVTTTGLLITEVIRERTEFSSDLFAGMLTAVGDFVRESMSKFLGEETEGALNTLGYEDYRILIESGRSTNLVVVVAGRENEFLIDDMRETLRKADKEHGAVLRDWDGEEDSVQGIERILRPLITSGKYDGIYYGKDDPKARRNLLFESISLGLARQSEMKPTVLCIEDLQWADPSTLALMHYVARNGRDKRLLILGSYRPEDVSSEHPLVETMQLMDREDLHEEMGLQRLPKEVTPDFLGLLGEVDFDDKFISRVYSETEGNPLFIVQLMKYLVEEEIIEPQDGIWRLTRTLDEVTIPSKVYNVIVRRLNHVEKEDRRILDYACVNGETFTSAVLAAALNARKSNVLERLRALEQTHRLIHSHDGTFKFDHAKIKEVLYNEIPQELRREYHEIVANSIERLNKDDLEPMIGDLAFHYYHARNGGKALDYLVRAAEKAKENYSNEEAIRFYTEALEFEEDRKKRMEMFEALGDIYYELTGEYDKSMEMYENALALAREKTKKAEIDVRIGHVHEVKGEYDKSINVCNEALDLVKSEDCKEAADAINWIGVCHKNSGEYDKALECYERGLRISEKIDNKRGVASAFNNIGQVHWLRGEYDKALECYERGLSIGEIAGLPAQIASNLTNMGNLYCERGEYDKGLECQERGLEIGEKIGDQQGIGASYVNMGVTESRRYNFEKALLSLERGLEIGEKIGDQRMICCSLAVIGYIHLRRANLNKALECLERGLEISEKIGHKKFMSYCLECIGKVHMHRGEYENSLKYIEKSLEIREKIGDQVGFAVSLIAVGIIHRERGDYEKALKDLKKSIEMAEKIGAQSDLPEAYCAIAEVLLAKADLEKAKEYCNLALSLATEMDQKKDVAKAKSILGMVCRERKVWKESMENFERSIEIFKEIGMNGELGHSHYEFGLMWKKKGDSEEASTNLRKALEIFERLKLDHKARGVNVALESLGK